MILLEHKPVAMCVGCNKYLEGLCTIYPMPPSFYVRQGACPFNPPKAEAVKKGFVNPLKASKRAKKGR